MVKDQVLLTHGSLHYLTKSRTLRRGMATLPRNSTFLSRSSSNTVTSKTEWISRTLLKPQYYHPTSIKNGHRQSQSTTRGRRKRRKKKKNVLGKNSSSPARETWRKSEVSERDSAGMKIEEEGKEDQESACY